MRASPVLALVAVALVVFLSTFAGVTRAAPSGASAPPDEAAIRAWIEQLDSNDLDTRHRAADALVQVGEPALPLLEQAFASGRHKAMGQPKIVLLKLRSMREDRLWNERLAALRDAAPTQAFLVRRHGRPDGRATVSLRPTGDPGVVDVRIEREPAGRAPKETIVATVALDRSLAPSAVRLEQAGQPPSSLSFAKGRVTGSWRGAAVDRSVAEPLALDWAIGLVACAMPFEAEATVMLAVLSSADATASSIGALRYAGTEPVRVAGQHIDGHVFLLGGGERPRRVVVDESRRIVTAEIGADLSIERMRSPATPR